MTKSKHQSRSFLPLVLAGTAIVIGVGLLVSFAHKGNQVSVPEAGSTNALQVIDAPGNDPRQQQSNSSAIQGAAKVSELMPGKDGAAVQQGQGVPQGSTSVDALLRNSQIQ